MSKLLKFMLVAVVVCTASNANAAVHRFIAPMDAFQATTVPAGTILPGFGDGSLFFDDVSGEVRYHFTFADLTGSPFVAHIHKGAVGMPGGVALGLPAAYLVPGEPTAGGYIGADVVDPITFGADLFAELLYVNVHTAAFGGGEIRGQLLFHSTVVPVPAAVWLLGSALGLLAARRRAI